MDVRPHRLPALIAALVVALLAATPAAAQPGGGDAEPVTLTLEIADMRDRQAAAAADEFVRLVAELSEGSITIAPTYGALGPTTAVIDGTADLAMVPTRDWQAHGVTSLDVFEAPFLIDSDPLADAIAESGIAVEAMAGLEAVGVTGLALWPEDLRHLFAFEPSGRVFRTLADIEGAAILAVAGQHGRDLIATLGGTLWQEGLREGAFTGDRHSDATSGALAGMVTGLWGAGLPIGDFTVVASDIFLFSKFQMLVANSAAFERLSPSQRGILVDAAEKTRESAIERRASESELALRHCSNGGRVIHAGDEAVAELKAAAAPVDEALRSDPVTGGLIADIEALKGEIPASPAAAPCDDASTIADESMFTDPSGYVGTVPPAGTYRAEITTEELLARGASQEFALGNAATVTWVFGDDGTYTFESFDLACPGVLESRDGIVWTTEEPGHPCGVGGGFRWREVPDGIAMALPYVEGLSVRDLTDLKAFFERTWTRIDGASAEAPVTTASQLPAPGAWRIEQSVESLTAVGLPEADAAQLAGVLTLTFDGDRWSMEHIWGPDQRISVCAGTHGLEAGYLVLRFETNPAECGTAATSLVWSAVGEDGATVTAPPGVEAWTAVFVGEWIRVDGEGIGLPPDGVYRVELTADELAAAGGSASFAGISTLSLDDGVADWALEDADGNTFGCSGTYAVVQAVVRFVWAGGPDCDVSEDVTWSESEAGLHFTLVAAENVDPFEDNAAAWSAKPWTRIDDT